MAVLVKKLYRNGAFPYKMQLLAGKNGLSNRVKWVHIIEDDDVSSFLHGNELVFTAGILNRKEGWLLRFAQKLHAARASAFVVNLGPYTKEIPKEVIDYCDEVALPLFTIPWEIRMVDMTRDFCQRIIQDEQTESNVVSALKGLLFGTGNAEENAARMEQYGYGADSELCFLAVRLREAENVDIDDMRHALEELAEKVAKARHELFVSFVYQQELILVLPNYSQGDIAWFIDQFLRQAAPVRKQAAMYVGVSPNRTGMYEQAANFEKALAAVGMAWRKHTTVCYYEQMGIYKLLYSVADRAVLREIYQGTVGALLQYDQDNHTNLVGLLRAYIENNGSLNQTAEQQYIHRNTVTNQLKKIESITGYNPFALQDKVMLFIGICAGDIL